MITRPGEVSGRIFPLIGPALYQQVASNTSTPDQRMARDLLAQQNFTWWQRLLGWKLDEPGRVKRLLLLHRHATEAEQEGQWKRADFFWQEAHRTLRHLAEQPQVWEKLAETAGGASGSIVMSDSLQVRQRLIDEVFLDTHCAFYNGQMQQAEAAISSSRAFVHYDYIDGLLDLSGMTAEEQLALFEPPAALRLTLLEKEKKWPEAIKTCKKILARLPDRIDYQDKLVLLLFSQTTAGLSKAESQAASLRDAETLATGIKRLKHFQTKYPYNVFAFELLGHLYNLRAVKLANGGCLSQALVENRRAVVYHPHQENAEAAARELEGMMTALQAQVKKAEAQLARQYNASLNEEGRRLQAEARRGFKPLNRYFESSEPEETRRAYQAAHARFMWRRIGLPEPEDRWDERAAALLDGLNRVLFQPMEDEAALEEAWQKVADEDADLAALDARPICAFVQRRRAGKQDEEAAPPAYPPPANPPLLEARPAKGWQKSEPFDYWLFSRQDVSTKLMAVAAVVLLLLAGGMSLGNDIYRNARNAAFVQIEQAETQRAYQDVLQGVEAFFAYVQKPGVDAREQEVLDLGNKALVRWLAGQDEELDAEDLAQIERYQTLITEYEMK